MQDLSLAPWSLHTYLLPTGAGPRLRTASLVIFLLLPLSIVQLPSVNIKRTTLV